MVYCGKPSKGCQMCRTRRIKCDETKPTCNQCAKSRRQCPGYKDEFDLVFRNETQATERRAKRANKKGLIQKTTGKLESYTQELQAASTSTDGAKSPLELTIVPFLNVPVEQQAACHFASNFIMSPREGNRGFMDFVVPLIKQEKQDHLQHAFNACTMAFLNNRGGTGGRFADKALREYTKALNGTNTALRSPNTQLSDSTLAAVLLLGLFESITAKQIGMLNWGSHTEGAIQLVKARGKQQLKTKIGVQLFIAVRTQMIIHSLTSGTTPIMGAEWWIDEGIRGNTAAKCHRLMIKTSELRAGVTRLMNSMARTPANIEVMLEMMRKLQTVDQEVVAWMRNVPEDWKFVTVAWEDHVPDGDYAKAEVFPGRIDLYQDLMISSVWNQARTARLILSSLVVRCAAWVCAPVDYRTTPEYATAARTCVGTITDVIASVPYNLGWHLGKNRHVLQKAQLDESFLARGFGGFGGFGGAEDSSAGDSNHVRALAGYFLTWPLTCLNSQDYTTDAQRAWVHGRLAHIGNELGVKYAHILRQLQIRIPSMLIRRDGLMASPYGDAHDMLRLVGPSSSSAAASSPRRHAKRGSQELRAHAQAQAQAYAPPVPPDLAAGCALAGAAADADADAARRAEEALRKEHFEKRRAELLAKASGGQNAGEGQRWVAERWLTV
ncbi:hypothetical protein GGR52DRAFT_586897 [Hypoxylon sp. FL1284]|nr:hypothetical protein GGR52DRAFT_586897 [Hypoxylon sp. FL1284]